MKAISIVLAIGLTVPLVAEPGRIMSGNASTKGFSCTWVTRLEPPSPPTDVGVNGGFVSGQSATHRFVTDDSRHQYFGYDMVVEHLDQADTFLVAFRPLSAGPEKLKYPWFDLTGWTMVPIPVYPAPQTVHFGDTIALDLLTNAATGQKVVDYIQVEELDAATAAAAAEHVRRLGTHTASGMARDFSIEDAELRMVEPRLSVNGKASESANFGSGFSGSAAWFYLPDRGRYIFSLVPHSQLGFQKAGEVNGTSLMFTVGSVTFALDCSQRIAPGSEPYNLYVFHDPTWRPRTGETNAPFLFGSADRAELLVRR
jgi:hypothetical protein